MQRLREWIDDEGGHSCPEVTLEGKNKNVLVYEQKVTTNKFKMHMETNEPTMKKSVETKNSEMVTYNMKTYRIERCHQEWYE